MSWQLFDLAGAGDTKSFVAALDALSDASPEELAFLNPLSVRTTCTMIFCKTKRMHGIFIFTYMQGQSILHVICGNGQVDAVAAVLKRGADANLHNKVSDIYVQNNSFCHIQFNLFPYIMKLISTII